MHCYDPAPGPESGRRNTGHDIFDRFVSLPGTTVGRENKD